MYTCLYILQPIQERLFGLNRVTSYLTGTAWTLMMVEKMDWTLYAATDPNSTLETETQDTFLQNAQAYMTFKLTKYIARYWLPLLLPFGLVGNTLSFLVMIRLNNRKISTCLYMAAISVNDNLLLCIDIRVWFVVAINTHKWYEWECEMNCYFANFSLQCTTYLVLAMTIDKYVAIKWPHRAATYSTPRRAKVIIVIIVTSVAMYNLPHFFMTALIAGKCYGYSVKSNLTKVYSWLTIVLNAIIPFTLLIHMNYIIVKTIRNSRKMFRSNVGTLRVDMRQKTMKTAENQLTTMLLLVTTLFLILLFPTYIRFIYAAFVISDTPSKFATSLLIFEISYKLYITNSGINFFLYCISGQKFRNDLKEIVSCIRRNGSSSGTEASTLSTMSF